MVIMGIVYYCLNHITIHMNPHEKSNTRPAQRSGVSCGAGWKKTINAIRLPQEKSGSFRKNHHAYHWSPILIHLNPYYDILIRINPY
jgi:hypothetical protein